MAELRRMFFSHTFSPGPSLRCLVVDYLGYFSNKTIHVIFDVIYKVNGNNLHTGVPGSKLLLRKPNNLSSEECLN